MSRDRRLDRLETLWQRQQAPEAWSVWEQDETDPDLFHRRGFRGALTGETMHRLELEGRPNTTWVEERDDMTIMYTPGLTRVYVGIRRGAW